MSILLIASFRVQSHTALISRLSSWYLDRRYADERLIVSQMAPRVVIVVHSGIVHPIYFCIVHQPIAIPIVSIIPHLIFPTRVLIFLLFSSIAILEK